jgi:predicted metal-dependent hydrolase
MRRNFLEKIFGLSRRRVKIVRTKQKRRSGLQGSGVSYRRHKEKARSIVETKLALWSCAYGVAYNKVAIRNQKSRWGSCSKKGNLNFHYRIHELPAHLQDYIIVHELCHLISFDHSREFWSHVAKTIPDHVARRYDLRTHAQWSPERP